MSLSSIIFRIERLCRLIERFCEAILPILIFMKNSPPHLAA
jgi:hypothetical protein